MKDLFDDEICNATRVLHLTLHKKWFDKILLKRKIYEFRIAKPYWKKRLEGKRYFVIHFRNGYASDAPFMEVEFIGLEKRVIKGIEFYCIKLGRILATRNIRIV